MNKTMTLCSLALNVVLIVCLAVVWVQGRQQIKQMVSDVSAVSSQRNQILLTELKANKSAEFKVESLVAMLSPEPKNNNDPDPRAWDVITP